MTASQTSLPNRWRLTGTISLMLLLASMAAFITATDAVDGTRMIIRMTAWTSLTLFAATFTASAAARFWPGSATGWLLTNRRYIGVGFAVSHGIHAAALITLARLDYAVFMQLTNLGAFIGGGLAYVFIVLMTATSFDRTAALVGRSAWRWLHLIGGWYIWISFALNFGKRVPLDPVYYGPTALIVLILAIRVAAFWLRPRKAGASSPVTTLTHGP